MKVCKICGIEKDVDDFKKCNSKSGRGAECKSCNAERSRNYYAKNKESRNKYSHNYHIANRVEQKQKQKKYRQINKDKKQKYRLEYRAVEENKNKINEAQKKYYHDNKQKSFEANQRRKAREMSAETFFITKKEIAKIYRDSCFACGSNENQSMDHRIPLSRGGVHGIGNLLTLCKSCNSSKGARTLSEWKYSELYSATCT